MGYFSTAQSASGVWSDNGTIVGLIAPGRGVLLGPNGRTNGNNLVALELSDAIIGVQTPGFGSRILWSSSAGGTKASIGFEVGGTGTNNETQISFYVQQSAAIAHVAATFGSAGAVFNPLGTDYDFRIASDTNQNHFVSDSGSFGGVGSISFGGAVSPNAQIFISSPAVNAAANQAFYRLAFIPGSVVTIPAGTAAEVATLMMFEPLIAATGTIADAYTLIIASAPTEATRNGALWVGSGNVRFSGMPTSAAGLPSGTLWNNSGVVNVAP